MEIDWIRGCDCNNPAKVDVAETTVVAVEKPGKMRNIFGRRKEAGLVGLAVWFGGERRVTGDSLDCTCG